MSANCSNGDTRLVDSSTHDSTSIGRVEVCINHAWGTVCDREFDDEDAQVICSQAGGYYRESERNSTSMMHTLLISKCMSIRTYISTIL